MASWLPAADGVSPLRPTRVLLVSRDRRFLGLATFLLLRCGFDVERVTRRSRALEAVGRGTVDVVVVDGSDSLPEALERAQAIRMLRPAVGVVVAADAPPPEHVPGVELVGKWSSAAALVDAVMRNRVRFGDGDLGAGDGR